MHNQAAVEAALTCWREAYGLALVMLGDAGRAEDLCQEAYLRLASMPRPVTDPGRVKPLLLQIVRNLVRSETRRPVAASLDHHAETAGPRLDPDAPDPAEEAEARESRRRLAGVLARLDPGWRLVLYLRDGLDLGYAEIAGITGRTVDGIRVTLHRARRRVREALERTEV